MNSDRRRQPLQSAAPRFGACSVVVVLMVVLACAAIGGPLARREYQRRELERRAPLVVPLEARQCSLSPDGRFLFVTMHNSVMASFYDTATRRRLMSVNLREYKAISGGHWLRGDVFLLRARLEDPSDESTASDLRDYVVVDLDAQQVSSTVGMTPAGRAALFAPLQQGAVAPRGHGYRPLPSPDGRLVMQSGGITTPDGTLVSPVPDGKILEICEHGWRPDSAGVYYLAGYRVGNWIGYTEYGPVRLLLVDPAHPPRP